jgi:hypothetical protein
MTGHDLDHPLRLDNCQKCGVVHWRDCVCTPGVRREPTAEEIETGREERLSLAERGRAGAGDE